MSTTPTMYPWEEIPPLAKATQYKISVMRFKTDDDPVFRKSESVMWMTVTGCVHEKSAPANPESNGPAEVPGRMVTWMGQTLGVDSGLLANMWPLFYDAVAYILNRLPTKSLDWKSPLGKLYELRFSPS